MDNVLEFVELEGGALLILIQTKLYPTTSGLRLGETLRNQIHSNSICNSKNGLDSRI